MNTAFDEVRKIAFRALDGAGAPAGTDEDGGWACAWLEAAEYPGLKVLADRLDQATPEHLTAGVSEIRDGAVDAGGASAICLGGALVELAAETGAIDIRNLNDPIYLLAFAARQAKHGSSMTVDLPSEAGREVRISPGGDGYAELEAKVHTAVVNGMTADDEAYDRVYAYSRAILVPQTEQSLLSGAGAGLTDND